MISSSRSCCKMFNVFLFCFPFSLVSGFLGPQIYCTPNQWTFLCSLWNLTWVLTEWVKCRCAWVSVSLLLNFGPRHFSLFTFPYILFPETCGVATPLTWNVSRKSYRTRVKFTADNAESGMCSQELPLEFNTHFIFGGKSITSKSCWTLTLDCVTMRNYAIWSSLKGNKGVQNHLMGS